MAPYTINKGIPFLIETNWYCNGFFAIHCLHDFAHKQDSQLNSLVLITVWRFVIEMWQDSQLNSSAFSHCSVWRVAIGKGVFLPTFLQSWCVGYRCIMAYISQFMFVSAKDISSNIIGLHVYDNCKKICRCAIGFLPCPANLLVESQTLNWCIPISPSRTLWRLRY